MKKIIVIAIPMLVSVMAFQSCMKPADNSKMNAKIDSLVNVRLTAFKDSLTKVCMGDVMTQAKMKADSMIMASMKKGGKTTTKKSAPPPPKEEKKSTIENRPGAANQGGTIQNRPGATNKKDSTNKSTISKRPGASNPPPK